MEKLAELTIHNFRAIKHAELQLSGITIVSGVNGCGKSTLSKLLYYSFRNANAFDELAIIRLNEEIRSYISVLEQIQFLLRYHHDTPAFGKFRSGSLTLHSLDKIDSFLSYIKELSNSFIQLEHDGKLPVRDKERMLMILRATFKKEESDENNVAKLLEHLVAKVTQKTQEAVRRSQERNYGLLRESLETVFGIDISKYVQLKEYGDAIVGDSVTSVPLMHYIRKVAYIDTPMMMIGMDETVNLSDYWREINELIKMPPKRGYKLSISRIIQNNILKGDITYSSDVFNTGFRYLRKDGKEFDLLECATGIKSFALLLMLLKNRFLEEDTLLIIDEPEAHLHPQWIIEYARLIVLLHKKVGVKFFIASHSTDMISALRYLSESEKCLDAVSFYVAESADEFGSSFTFQSLGHDIEPIFASFNKSFEKLDAYVSKEN